MPTSIHIPAPLLGQVSRRARAEGLSRNRYIVDALRRTVESPETWPPAFLRAIAAMKPSRSVESATDEMMRAIRQARRSRRRRPF